MPKLAELRKSRDELKAKGRALVVAADNDNRDMTDEELANAKTIQSDIAKLDDQISREEAKIEAARAFGDDEVTGEGRVEPQPRNVEEHRRGGFRNLADFGVAVRNASQPGGQTDDRLANLYRPANANLNYRPASAPANFHQESGGTSNEGYLVPPAFRDGIWEVALQTVDLLSLADTQPTSQRQVSGISDESTPWGSSGIQASWRAEGTQMSASKLAQNPRSTTLHELYCFVLATGELLEDAPLLNSRLERQAARAIGWEASDAIMWGNGVGKPMGFMNSTALVTVNKESSQTAATVVVKNIAKMLARLLATPGARPLWLVNSQIIPELVEMKIGDTPVFTTAGGLPGAMSGSLLGYPILFTEHATTLGAVGDITLVDMQGYEAYRRSTGPDFATSMHLFFDYNIEAFRWIFRFGGQPYLSKPVDGAKTGSSSKSHFVTLAERA